MKKTAAALFAALICVFLPLSAFAETETDFDGALIETAAYTESDDDVTEENADYGSSVVDLCGILSSYEQSALENLVSSTADTISVNIAVLISDNVGADKSDSGVVDFADTYYEDLFGIDTDGILLLINEDKKYDYISTSGRCIDIFDSGVIDSMFNDFSDYIVSGDYVQAVQIFLNDLAYYTELYYQKEDEYSPDDDYVDDFPDYVVTDYQEYQSSPRNMFSPASIIVILIIAGGIAAIYFFSVKRKYVLLQPFPKRNYLDESSVFFADSSDVFVRSYVVETSNDSNMHHHGGSHGGGGSSHVSSGGGSHGGGGHHR